MKGKLIRGIRRGGESDQQNGGKGHGDRGKPGRKGRVVIKGGQKVRQCDLK